MSSAGPAGVDGSFHDRLNKVAARRPARADVASPEVALLPDWRENIRVPLGYAASAAAGAAAVFLVRLVRFHATGGQLVGDSPDLNMAIDFVGGFAVALVAYKIMSHKGFPFVLAQLAGVVLMLTTMQNLVHSAPWAFRLIFSPAWTDAALAETRPGSFLVRGHSLPIYGSDDEKKETAAAPAKKTDEVASFLTGGSTAESIVTKGTAAAATAPAPVAPQIESVDGKPATTAELPKVMKLGSSSKSGLPQIGR